MDKIKAISWVILLTSVSFTFLLWFGFSHNLTESQQISFQSDADLLTLLIHDELDQYEQVLIGAEGLFAASDEVNLSEWHTFVEIQNIETRFPGLQGVGYAQHVLHEDREKLISKMKSYGDDTFEIQPDGNRDEYYPVLFLEPSNLRNLQAIGYDIYFEQTRKNTVNSLIKTGDTTMTGKITLIQEIDEDVQNGFLMLVPVYSNADPDRLQGIVYTVFRINDFIAGTVDVKEFEYLKLKIYDNQISNDSLFFDSYDINGNEFDSADFSTSITTPINNRDWIFVYEGVQTPLEQIDYMILLSIPIIGFSTSILLFYIFRIISKNLKLTNDAIKNEKISTIGTMGLRLSHDLQNPLAVIKMSLQLMTMNLSSMDEKTKKYVNRIESASNSMSNIIKDVLEFSKSSSLQKENVSLNEIFQNVLSGIDIPDRIKIILPKKDFSLKCDKSKIQSVFSNLLTNAIQSITNDGKISIFVREESGFFIISFEDSGPGIPKDQISEIFEPLFTTKQKGTGLGLAICKTIIEKHGGTISVKNNPTTFTIKLPKYLE